MNMLKWFYNNIMKKTFINAIFFQILVSIQRWQ